MTPTNERRAFVIAGAIGVALIVLGLSHCAGAAEACPGTSRTQAVEDADVKANVPDAEILNVTDAKIVAAQVADVHKFTGSGPARPAVTMEVVSSPALAGRGVVAIGFFDAQGCSDGSTIGPADRVAAILAGKDPDAVDPKAI